MRMRTRREVGGDVREVSARVNLRYETVAARTECEPYHANAVTITAPSATPPQPPNRPYRRPRRAKPQTAPKPVPARELHPGEKPERPRRDEQPNRAALSLMRVEYRLPRRKMEQRIAPTRKHKCSTFKW